MTTTHLIDTTREASRAFVRLASNADEIWVASAWASDQTDVAKALWKARSRIAHLVVGLDFYQTEPAFLKRFRPYARVHQSADGVFHPKLYLFRRGKSFDCLVGSSNFTRGGFGANTETNVVLGGTTAERFFHTVRERIEEFADRGRRLSERELEHYTKAHAARRRDARRLREYRPLRLNAKGIGLDVPWDAYVARLLKRGNRHTIYPTLKSLGYIGVINEVQAIFKKKKRLSAMTIEERRHVAGLEGEYKYFGSMVGAGYFKNHILSHPERLDRALDHIPSGRVSITYEQFEAFRRALPKKGMGKPAVGSRLLAMKRPDRFMCVDSANRTKLSQVFGLSQGGLNTYDGYWELLQLLWGCAWCKSPRPSGKHRQAWDARVALVDAFYYDP
jgi:phospholipase D-like protein